MVLLLSDDELVARCKRELPTNTSGYELLVRRYRRQVHFLVYGMVRNYEDAEDITQEIFLKVFRHLNQFEQRSSFSTWLYRVAMNCILDTCKKGGHQNKLMVSISNCERTHSPEGSRAFALSTLPTMSLEDCVLQAEQREAIQLVLTRLDADQARLLLLHDLYGLSYEELAQHFQVSLSALKMRLLRVRLAFREGFEQQDREGNQKVAIDNY